jgi:hypothetical protein
MNLNEYITSLTAFVTIFAGMIAYFHRDINKQIEKIDASTTKQIDRLDANMQKQAERNLDAIP